VSLKYLVDTDWVIDAFIGTPTCVQLLDRLSNDGLGVSITTSGELFEGAFSVPDPQIYLAQFRVPLNRFTTAPLSDSIMEVFARTRAQLRRSGQLIPDMDLLIAATAQDAGLVLVTRSRRHFERVPDLMLFQPR
jgi:tRNA(fMet)-specific endonuclease VapC